MTVTAIRFPFLGGPERLAHRVRLHTDTPRDGAAELWTYLHTTDAAAACLLGVTTAPPGNHVVFVAAPETHAPYETEALLDEFHPGVPRRMRFPGRMVPMTLEAGERLLGFKAEHLWPVEVLPRG